MQHSLNVIRNQADDAPSWYDFLTQAPWWPLVAWAAAVGLGLIIIGSLTVATRQYRLASRSEKAARFQNNALRLPWFGVQDFVGATKDYIVPYCSTVDPGNPEALLNTDIIREPVFGAIARALATEDSRHILILADAGMGKTTLLLNLVARTQKPRRTALVPLGVADALERLNALPDKHETVLLLDAFDEDPRAIEDATTRMEEIMAAAAPFKGVVMTCRSQFFPSNEGISRRGGIIAVAAQDAGSPVIDQWFALYLQPFDHQQIDQYIRKAIAWRRFGQRNKAKRIVADISDLATQPMLTALIPGLAASDRAVHSLWDLYAFMVDTWILREGSWLAPEVLRRISKAVAVDLVDKRSARGTERISHTELVALSKAENTSIETWRLTSRSLLNRDADGYYKFAHRSILEFFFIEAFLDGEQRCLSTAWTDMMCDLFLSWGSSTHADNELAHRLLCADFHATNLFPLAKRHQPSARLDNQWVKDVFSTGISIGARPGFPSSWRSMVTHFMDLGTMARAYDIADGLVWQLDITNAIHDRADRDIHQHHRYSLCGTDDRGREWAVVDLYELKLLCNILATRQTLHSVIDERELYWLADAGDGIFSALARIRPSTLGEALSYADLEFIHSGSDSRYPSYTIDVYRTATKGFAVNKVLAMTILAHHGDAAALLANDKGDMKASSWGIYRESRLPMNQSHCAASPVTSHNVLAHG